SLLSGALLVLPVAVTVGVYIGVESQRIFHGGGNYNPFTPGGNGGGGGGGGGGRHKYTTETFCQKAYGITPFPGRYIFNPNQWGDKENLGALCMNITTDAATPKDSLVAAGFTATWHYPPASAAAPVHAFPNAKLLLPDTIPVQLSNLSSLTLDVEWTYGLGNYAHNETNNTAIAAGGVNANVAVDMFLANDRDNSTSTSDAAYEVMVWLGRWGDATDPIGLFNGSRATHDANGTVFDLYYGDNDLGQRVFTWVAQQNVTAFTGDIGPLLQRLSNFSGPGEEAYLGYLAFGSEVLYSFENATIYVPKLEMDVL
ncbi:glycoside hydrolase family 12 protein, partial [Glonium stellatum]